MLEPISNDELVGRSQKIWLRAERAAHNLGLEPDGQEQEALERDTAVFIIDLFKELPCETDPKKLIRTAFKALDEIEQRSLVIQNLLEAVKRGEEFSDVLGTYEGLGLTGPIILSPVQKQDETPEKRTSAQAKRKNPGGRPKIEEPESGGLPAMPDAPGGRLGRFLMKLAGALRRFVLWLYEVICNALAAITDVVEVQPNIGFVGGIPSLSFSIETGALSVRDLIDILVPGDD
jgi:hypothetical protein